MTRQEELAKIAKENVKLLGNLWARWQDEREFEDFAEYVAMTKSVIEKSGGTFVKLDKRFNLTLRVQNVECYIKVGARGATWGTTGKK
jgi:hypothetical protein